MITWTVANNDGNRAELEAGPIKNEVLRPAKMAAIEFGEWLRPGATIDDEILDKLAQWNSEASRAAG